MESAKEPASAEENKLNGFQFYPMISTSQAILISGIGVLDSKLANEITEFTRDTETNLLSCHSSRIYSFGALIGRRHFP